MPYTLSVAETDVLDEGKYKNEKGNTECVVFVQQTTSAPSTTLWKRGIRVKDAAIGSIPRGTVIATFDESGNYPTDSLGRHAAVYLTHNAKKITVLDQWNKQGAVKKRDIHFDRPAGTSRSNDGNTFYVVE